MNTIKRKCDWCGSETELQEEEPTPLALQKCHLCPSCVISILPKTPVISEQHNTTSESDEVERRRIERLPVQTRVYLTRSGQAVEVIGVTLLDISDAGMKIQMQQMLDVNETVTIGFLSQDLIYKAIGTVRHIRKETAGNRVFFETGLRITGIHQELRL